MHLIIAAFMWAQVILPPRAYVLLDANQWVLATDTGRYAIELDRGCEAIVPNVNVDFLPGSGGVVAIELNGTGICNLIIDGRVSDVPCAQVDDVCDIAAEQVGP